MSGPNPLLDADAARRLLGLEPGADAGAIARAFAEAVKAAHPDRPGGDGERLRAVIEARRVLRAAPAEWRAPAEPDRRLEISPRQAMRGGFAWLPLDGRRVRVRLPVGLRSGDLVRVAGERLEVAVMRRGAASVAGDDVVIVLLVEAELLRRGGKLSVDTPGGQASCWISAADAARGFVRLPGRGLPARGRRRLGDLIVRLEAAAEAPAESLAQAKLRRFAAAWAA